MARPRHLVSLLLLPFALCVQACCCGAGSGGGTGEMLVSAAGRGDAQRVRELLDAGAPPHSSVWSSRGTRLGSTKSAVEAAVDSGVWEVVEPLLVDQRLKQDALRHAVQWANPDIIRRLVEKGAKFSPELAFAAYDRALRLVDRARSETLVKLLMELGIDPNATKEHYGDATHVPLVSFVIQGLAWHKEDGGASADGVFISRWGPEVFILNARPRLDVQDSNGRTPLMDAAEHGAQDLVQLLLEHGADPALLDKDGRDAAFHASRWGHDAVVAMLKALPPRTSKPGP
ncbi:MAG: ankyrin repeat domain-containing protein [Myxococcaceae bacterium]|nr:MAG: ankyrin repeat domain-containing protein [Myxococcaceae bacterium]